LEIDSKYYRPTEVDLLIGDPSKAKRQLGWEPKTSFSELVRLMVDADMAEVTREANKGD
jgi:GDPmannose 4,6-dehydratase